MMGAEAMVMTVISGGINAGEKNNDYENDDYL